MGHFAPASSQAPRSRQRAICHNRQPEVSSMAPSTIPNLFNLAGEGLTVSYSTTSIDGKPRFTFKKGRKTLTFAGSEITSVAAGIGTLVSVVIAQVPDKSTTTFSVLLPAIKLTG